MKGVGIVLLALVKADALLFVVNQRFRVNTVTREYIIECKVKQFIFFRQRILLFFYCLAKIQSRRYYQELKELENPFRLLTKGTRTDAKPLLSPDERGSQEGV